MVDKLEKCVARPLLRTKANKNGKNSEKHRPTLFRVKAMAAV